MSTLPPLTKDRQRHTLRLVRKGAEADGWTPVSAQLFPLVQQVPSALLDTRPLADGRGQARLTQSGNDVLDYA